MTVKHINLAPIWRYLRAEYALDELTKRQLHFQRVDQFGDKWEGFEGSGVSSSPPNIQDLVLKSTARGQKSASSQRKTQDDIRESYYASCWSTVSPNQMQMWNAFTKGAFNWVALGTTFARLQEALPIAHSSLRIGSIAYLTEEAIQNTYLKDEFEILFRKRTAFQYEREVRVVIAPGVEPASSTKSSDLALGNGYVQLQMTAPFVTELVLHPRMSHALEERIAKVLKVLPSVIQLQRSAVSKNPR